LAVGIGKTPPVTGYHLEEYDSSVSILEIPFLPENPDKEYIIGTMSGM